MATRDYDLIVIGAGPVGENIADRAKQGGLTVVVVESELVGGECSYWACMPSKTLLRSGAALRAARDVDGARQSVRGSVDVAAALRRRDAIVYDWNDTSQVDWLDATGIDLVRGHGRRRRRQRGDHAPGAARGGRVDRVGGDASRHPGTDGCRPLDEPRCHR